MWHHHLEKSELKSRGEVLSLRLQCKPCPRCEVSGSLALFSAQGLAGLCRKCCFCVLYVESDCPNEQLPTLLISVVPALILLSHLLGLDKGRACLNSRIRARADKENNNILRFPNSLKTLGIVERQLRALWIRRDQAKSGFVIQGQERELQNGIETLRRKQGVCGTLTRVF